MVMYRGCIRYKRGEFHLADKANDVVSEIALLIDRFFSRDATDPATPATRKQFSKLECYKADVSNLAVAAVHL